MTVQGQIGDCVVVLDRDGTINIDCHYLSDPGRLELLPGSAAALRWFNEFGIRVVVITNQSGVARGLMTLEDVETVNRRLQHIVREFGGRLDAIYVCPHHPDDACLCRKPGTALLERAARELAFEPGGAFVVGDKPSDVEMGRRLGSRTILIGTPGSEPARMCEPDFIATDLLEAAKIIMARWPTAAARGHLEAGS